MGKGRIGTSTPFPPLPLALSPVRSSTTGSHAFSAVMYCNLAFFPPPFPTPSPPLLLGHPEQGGSRRQRSVPPASSTAGSHAVQFPLPHREQRVVTHMREGNQRDASQSATGGTRRGVGEGSLGGSCCLQDSSCWISFE